MPSYAYFRRWSAILLTLNLLSLPACGGGGGSSGSSSSPQPAPSGGWVSTGNLNTARDSHSATVLPYGPNAGKVLVAGGGIGTAVFNSAELYSPSNGIWTPTASMTSPRENHSATVLPNGTILVAGGLTTTTNATASAEVYDPVNGTWSTTGSMNNARAFHTATLLPNGTVLVAGGTATNPSSGGASLNTAEVYDPAVGNWTPVGNMVTFRQAHTATLLPTGKVLAAGGANTGAPQAELYDPSSQTWAATGNMSSARSFHGAALLPTGKVLVAGGSLLSAPLASAELYDPAAGTWIGTGSMSISRSGPTAVLLPNGNVLMAGGLTGNTVAASAELYVPGTGTWSPAGSIGTARTSHSTTLLPTGQALVAGGIGLGSVRLASAVLYTPAMPGSSGTWSAAGNLNMARQFHSMTLLRSGPDAGKVLVAGGLSGGGVTTATAELFDPTTRTWTATGPMTVARQLHTAILLISGPNAGKVLVAGGLDDGANFLASAELYDPIARTWTGTGAMNDSRIRHQAATITAGPQAGKVLVSGGVTSGPIILASAELYDPVSGTWSGTGAMTDPRQLFTLTVLPTGKLLAASGVTTGSSITATAELYDPATSTWTMTGSLLTGRPAHTASLLTLPPTGGRVLVAGGENDMGDGTASSELYDPVAGTWSATGSLLQARASFTATVLPNGRVLAAGGNTVGNAVTPTTELYNPLTGSWAASGPLVTARSLHTALFLPQGQGLVAGGSVSGVPSAASEQYSTSVP